MIAWPAGFAPAPGDRRSPLQVGSPARTIFKCGYPVAQGRVSAFAYGPHFRNGTSFFLESEPCARPMRNRSIPVRMDTVIVTVPVVGATGGRPREPLNSGHRTNWRGLFSPAPMIAWPAGFAPAPGDRRSPLQVGSSAIARRRGFAQRHRRSRPRL